MFARKDPFSGGKAGIELLHFLMVLKQASWLLLYGKTMRASRHMSFPTEGGQYLVHLQGGHVIKI